jgi:hypothetical protein
MVLKLFLNTDIGLGHDEFVAMADEIGIEDEEALLIFDQLKSMNLVRIQDRSAELRPDRLKATAKAFSL